MGCDVWKIFKCAVRMQVVSFINGNTTINIVNVLHKKLRIELSFL